MDTDLNIKARRLEISLNKTKLMLSFIGALAFVVIGGVFAVSPTTFADTTNGHRPVLFITVIGFASIVFFGTCAILISTKLFNKKPGLVIDENGITINNGIPAFVAWDEIEGLGVMNVKRTKIVLFYLKEPEVYIKRQKGFFRRTLCLVNYKAYNSPVSISSNGLKCNFDELHSLIIERLNK